MPTLPQFAPAESREELLRAIAKVQRGLVEEPIARLPCGVAAIDTLLQGGWPRGRLSELYGTRSCGKTTLALHLLAAVTGRREIGAWIDAADAVHPLSLVAAGVDLSRVLWVRPRSFPEALRSAEVVLSTKGIALVVLDCGERAARFPSRAAWLRLQRAAARSHAVLLLLAPHSLAGSFAALRLRLQANGGQWVRAGQREFLEGLRAFVVVERNRIGRENQRLGWEVRWPSAVGSAGLGV
ncbi:MAG: DNA recombination/repair protein RecA [Candidatus Binatia bacterium]|nr:DNA recombination/repair protein RecA [Candidatus Binatia bacterium]